MTIIEGVAVVVPVHNEAEHLPACLDALARALAPLSLPCAVVIVLDSCTDESERIARAWPWGDVIALSSKNVGEARAAGMSRALAMLGAHDPARVWLTTTDADSVVPECWLTSQLALAADGAQAVAGTIEVLDWSEYAPELSAQFRAFYDAHDHVHGANLGVRGDAYLAAGGFLPLATGEDHALWGALGKADCPRVSSRALAVITSARRQARAPHGFSEFLADFRPSSSS